MTQAPTPALGDVLDAFSVAVLAAEEGDIKKVQKNAMSKQYDVQVVIKITETTGNKPYFDNDWKYTGLPYGAVVVLEHELVKIVNKLVVLGGEIATGGELPPQA